MYHLIFFHLHVIIYIIHIQVFCNFYLFIFYQRKGSYYIDSSVPLFFSVVVAQLLSRVLLFLSPMDYKLARLLCPLDFPGKNTGVGCHSPLSPADLPNPGVESIPLCLLHWQADSLLLSHQRSRLFTNTIFKGPFSILTATQNSRLQS